MLLSIYPRYSQDSFLRERMETKLYALRAEIDLACLNSGNGGCRTTDHFGQAYIRQGNVFVAARSWKKVDLKRAK